jgi:hypothetical protein
MGSSIRELSSPLFSRFVLLLWYVIDVRIRICIVSLYAACQLVKTPNNCTNQSAFDLWQMVPCGPIGTLHASIFDAWHAK